MRHGIERGRRGRRGRARCREDVFGVERHKVLFRVEGGIKLFMWIDRQKVCEKTSSMRRRHRGSRESSHGISASLVGGNNIQTRSEDVDTFAEVGKVGTFIAESRSTNRNSFL